MSGRLILLSRDADLRPLRELIQREAPDLVVSLPGDPGAECASMAVCWNPPEGSLGALPELRLVHSIAAGIDNLLRDSSLPDVPVCRVVDPDLRQGMAEYVLWGVLHYHRHLDQMLAQQPKRIWKEPAQRPAKACHVGVMGLGALGSYCATLLAGMGFQTRGWARSPKMITGVQTWAGPEGLAGFLDGLDVLVCLLPLTNETRGLINADTLSRLAPGAALINCGRGEHLLLPDLLAALESGQLRGALLDVFEQEPLAADDPLWTTPGLTLTPHMASSASLECIARQVVVNFRRVQAGEPLLNQADPHAGY